MKKLVIFLFLIISLVSQATTYYVATTGSNSNNGSSATPWLTLVYASTHTIAGDIIHIKAGTYSITSQIILPMGVSIEGDGVTSVISSTYSTTDGATLLLSSGAEGTNGNQSISYIKMDGNNLIAQTAIEIDARKNIIIHDCTIINFASWGVIFNGLTGYGSTAPGTYATGNQFYNNTVTNCAGYGGGYGHGNLAVGGQQGFLCHDNVITQTSRGGAGSHGWCWKYYSEGYNKDIKIYNNTFIKPPFNGDWDFAMEFCMNEQGGIEIYNNTVDGAIDMGARRKGAYAYSFYIHNNILGKTTRDNVREAVLIFENVVEDCIVEDNYFHNLSHGIGFSVGGTGDHATNLYVRYNIFDQMGNSNECWGVYSYPGESVSVNTNVYFYNNVFTALAGNTYGIGIALPPSGTSSYWYIRNNIFIGFSYAWVTAYGDGTMNYLYLQNNIAYSNGNSNNPLWESPYNPTNVTNTNLIKSNPLFVSANSDWHLQTGSPAINAGVNVGLTKDYAGNAVSNPPEIGAYEYGTVSVTVPTVTTTAVTNITSNNAQSGGTITNNGGGAITAAGICWATTPTPTLANSYTSDYYGSSPYISYFGGLLIRGVAYYVRAYATNSAGTGYGSVLSFTVPLATTYKVMDGLKVITVSGKTITVSQ